jgi:hypothetical protein
MTDFSLTSRQDMLTWFVAIMAILAVVILVLEAIFNQEKAAAPNSSAGIQKKARRGKFD